MTVQQIRNDQIRDDTITNAKIKSDAAIALTKLAEAVIQADGGQAFTGNQSMGNNKITNLLDATADSDVPSWGQVKALNTGRDWKDSVRVATTAAGTLASSFENGDSVDGVTLATGDRILIKDQAAASENGIYTVNATGAPTRATDADSSTEVTAGMSVPVEEGTANSDTVWTLTTNGAITLGSTALNFSQTGETLTVDGSLTRTGHQLSRSALTGDVTASAGSNATTIANAAVSLAKMANLAANSVIGNNTGSAATPTALALASAATASAVAIRDGNANARYNNLIKNFQTVASAAGTTTLTVSSPYRTQITGSTTQTVVLPDATTLVVGQEFMVINRSSGNVQVNANGGGAVQTMVGGSFATFTVTAIGSAAGSWDAAYTAAGGSGSVTTVSVVSANGFAGSVANASTTPAITLSTSVTGVLKGNGTAISAATNGTDYVNNSNFVTRETPSGTINGSNATFTLANTPVAGTEQVFLNGILLEPGAGNDYTISGATITMLTTMIPVSGDKLRVNYMK